MSANAVKAPVEVTFKATGVSEIRNGLKLVKTEAAASQQQVAMGARQAAGALSDMAAQAAAGQGSLKLLVTSGAQMALMFGAGGPLVGALGLLGLAAFNAFSSVRDQMEETRKKFKDEVDAMVNAADFAGLKQKARSILEGGAGDRDASGNAMPYSNGLERKRRYIGYAQSNLDALKQELNSGTSKKTVVALLAEINAANERLKTLKEDAKELEQNYADTVELILNPGNAAKSGTGAVPIVTRARSNQDMKTAFEEATRLETERLETALHRADLLRKLSADVKAKVKEIEANEIETSIKVQTANVTKIFEQAEASAKQYWEGIRSISRGIATDIAGVFSAGIEGGFAAAGRALIGALGGMLKDFGIKALAGLTLMEAISQAIAAFNPALGIAASVGLIALGSAMQSFGGGSHGSGGSTGGGSSAGGSYSAGSVGQIIDRGIINMSNVTPRTPMTFNLGLFNPNDAGAQRFVDEVNRKIGQRGSLAGGG